LFNLEKAYSLLWKFADQNSIEAPGPLDAFKEAAASGAVLYIDNDLHLTNACHNMFADQIAKILE